MEPLTVICSTCQSRIRVRNAALVGQLVNCPRCQSLVLIADPNSGDALPSSHPPVDSRALTKDGLDPDGLGTLPSTSQSVDDELRLLPVDDAVVAVGTTSPAAHPMRVDELHSASWQGTGRAAPGESWTTEKTIRRRQLLMVGAFGLASVALSGILFVLVLSWYNRPVQNADAGTPAENRSQPAEPVAQDSSEPATLEPAESPSVAQSDAPPSDPPVDQNVSSAEPSAESVDTESPDAEAPEISVKEDAEPSNEEQPQAEQVNEALPQHLRELAALIGEPYKFAAPEVLVVPDRAPVTAEELGLASASIDKSLAPIDLHAVANQRLIRGLKLDEIPLAHAVNYFSLAAGVPMSVDDFSLSAAGYDRFQRVSLVLSSGTVDASAQKFAELVGLQIQPIQNQFYRLHANLPDDDRWPGQVAVNDLVNNDEHQQWLLNTLNTFIPGAAEGLTLDGNNLVIDSQKIERRMSIAIIRLLEDWRHTAGLTSQMTAPSNTFRPTAFTLAEKAPRLSELLKNQTSSSRPIADVLSAACAQVGIDCWIDWPTLRMLGLEPATPILSITSGRPLRGMLQELEFQYGLTTAIIDEKTLWITSQSTYRQSPDVFVLPSEDRDIEYWQQYFRPLTPMDASGSSRLDVILSPDGKCVFVRCCFPSLRFP